MNIDLSCIYMTDCYCDGRCAAAFYFEPAAGRVAPCTSTPDWRNPDRSSLQNSPRTRRSSAQGARSHRISALKCWGCESHAMRHPPRAPACSSPISIADICALGGVRNGDRLASVENPDFMNLWFFLNSWILPNFKMSSEFFYFEFQYFNFHWRIKITLLNSHKNTQQWLTSHTQISIIWFY